jgi:hypothetical protein
MGVSKGKPGSELLDVTYGKMKVRVRRGHFKDLDLLQIDITMLV